MMNDQELSYFVALVKTLELIDQRLAGIEFYLKGILEDMNERTTRGQ